MKVICVDNLARDYNGGKSETVHGENLTQGEAEALAKKLNEERGGEFSIDYFVVKPDDYQPYIFEGY